MSLTNGAGVSKSHLSKTMFLSGSKLLLYKSGSPEKLRILPLAPKEVFYVNLKGKLSILVWKIELIELSALIVKR